jgi:hypothetical protein
MMPHKDRLLFLLLLLQNKNLLDFYHIGHTTPQLRVARSEWNPK